MGGKEKITHSRWILYILRCNKWEKVNRKLS